MNADTDTDTDAGDGADAGTPERPVELETGDDIDAFVAAHDVALVEIYRPGCTLCESMEPILDGVARSSGVAVGACNPQRDLDLVADYDVRSVPTLLLFVDGELVGRLAEGFVGVDRVLGFVAEALGDDRRDVLPAEHR